MRFLLPAATALLLLATTAVAQESGGRHELGGTAAPLEVPPPMDVPYRQIVDPARYVEGSVSLGTTSDGRLNNSRQLQDEGEHHFVLPEHRSRDTHYGTDEMIRVILDAAARSHAESGVRVGVGNIANPAGGDLYWSRSHNNGRDADLAFPLVDTSGASVEPETLITLRRDGTARDGSGRRFDVPAAWALVEALLTSREAQVQWIFIYDPLKQMLLAHAEAVGADPHVIALAAEILHQPGDSAPHDDHFHLRIFCSRDDRLEGCTNWGPEWSHAALWDEAVQARVAELARGLTDPDPATAAECLGRVNQLAGESAVPAVALALPHAEPAVQIAMMEVLAEHDQPGFAGAIVPLLESSPADDVRAQAAWLLGYLADPTSAAPLGALVARGGDPLDDGTPVEVAAAHALRNVWAPESVPWLIERAADPNPAIRSEVARVLARATGRIWLGDTGEVLDDAGLAELDAFWRDWWATHGGTSQGDWYLAALPDVAGGAQRWEDVALADLVQALRDPREHVRFIADRTLLTRTNGWTPSEGWTVDRRWRYWADRLGVR